MSLTLLLNFAKAETPRGPQQGGLGTGREVVGHEMGGGGRKRQTGQARGAPRLRTAADGGGVVRHRGGPRQCTL